MFEMGLKTKGPIFSERRRKKVTETEVRSAVEDSTAKLIREVKLLTPVSRGTLRRSIMGKIEGKGTALRGRVFTNIKYGIPVERGHHIESKGWPPQANIIAWLLRPAKTIKTEGATVEQVAFLISSRMRAKGVKGKWMFRDGLKKSANFIKQRFLQVGIKMKKGFE
jgi:hypothetical protein